MKLSEDRFMVTKSRMCIKGQWYDAKRYSYETQYFIYDILFVAGDEIYLRNNIPMKKHIVHGLIKKHYNLR